MTYTAATGETGWMSLGVGNVIGVLWGAGWLDYPGHDPYWGNGMILAVLLLTVVSRKARMPHSPYLQWIDRVYWNQSGRILVDDGDRCVEGPTHHFPVGFALSAAARTTTHDSDADSDDSCDDVNDSDSENPSDPDSEMDGRLPSQAFVETGNDHGGSDGDDETRRLLTQSMESPTPTIHFRSRRPGLSSVLADSAERRDR